MNIIKHKGEPTKAVTDQGQTVHRQPSLYADEYGIIPCTPYGEHFIYLNPDKRAGTPSFLCTCGSIAVIANVYEDKKRAFVCMHHATYGFHQTSMVNKKDFEQGKPVIMKGKKWV